MPLKNLDHIQEDNVGFIGDRSFCRTLLAATVLMAVLLAISGIGGEAQAKLVKQEAKADVSNPDAVFTAIAAAWENGDEEALSDLVHEDGLRVTGGEYDKFTNYSPSQAYYYFKNQFRIHQTVSFGFERLQEKLSGQDRVHGMVIWEYRRASGAEVQEKRLVLVLTRQGDDWRLSEINPISMK